MEDWLGVENDMAFYCSYCLLSNTHPKLMRYTSERSDISHLPVIGKLDPAIGFHTYGHALQVDIHVCITLNKGVDPYEFVDTVYKELGNGFQYRGVDISYGWANVEETDNEIRLTCGMISPVGMREILLKCVIYKHSYATPELTLASKRFPDQTILTSKNEGIMTICGAACDVRCSNITLKSKTAPIHYKLEKGQSILSVSEECIADYTFDYYKKMVYSFLVPKDVLGCTREYILELVREKHTPSSIPPIDPYTQWGETPEQYRRIWSFLHCCRSNPDLLLPECLLKYLLRYIGRTYFVLAERRIEAYKSDGS